MTRLRLSISACAQGIQTKRTVAGVSWDFFYVCCSLVIIFFYYFPSPDFLFILAIYLLPSLPTISGYYCLCFSREFLLYSVF